MAGCPGTVSRGSCIGFVPPDRFLLRGLECVPEVGNVEERLILEGVAVNSLTLCIHKNYNIIREIVLSLTYTLMYGLLPCSPPPLKTCIICVVLG